MKNNLIPDNWVRKAIEPYVYIKGRIGWRGLKKSEYTDEGPCLIANKHLKKGAIDWKNCDHLSEYRYEESPEIQLENEDIILSKDGTIGEVAIIKKLPGKATINSTMMLLRADKEHIISDYLFYNLQSNEFKRYIKIQTAGTSIPHLFQRDMKQYEVSIPPLVEQRGIVGVLGTVDECIRLTDAVIERAEELKRGLMQQLLTRGIGHTEYKETPLGKIPKTWKIKQLQDISIITGGSTPSTTNSDYWGGDIPFVTPSDITSLENENYISKTRRNITKKGLISTSSSLLDPQTILLTSRATLGEAAINLLPVSTNQGFANIKPDSNVDVLWLLYYLRSKKREIERLASGSTFKEVSKRSIKRMNVTLPPLKEQTRISMIFQSMHEKIKSEYEKGRNLRLIKQGIMQQLLSGKIRVELKGDGLHRIRDGREANN